MRSCRHKVIGSLISSDACIGVDIEAMVYGTGSLQAWNSNPPECLQSPEGFASSKL